MHKVTKKAQKLTKGEYNYRLTYYNLGEAVASHMFYVYMIVLYDKMGFSMKQIHNFNEKLFEIKSKYIDENDDEITRERLLMYATSKKTDLVGFTRSVPTSDVLNLADIKKSLRDAPSASKYGLLSTLLLVLPVLKENYRFSQAKMDEFLKWVKYAIKMYNTKLPKDKGNVYTDEYIRQIFIEDEKFDFRYGETVA